MGSDDKFDVIIIGAGLAGSTAALVCARAGLSTVLFERGERPGSKNMFGGILFTPVIGELIPNFWEEAPVERPIVKKEFSFLAKDNSLTMVFQSEKFRKPPYNNNFSALRARFDEWYAAKAEEAGAIVFPETVVDDVIWDDKHERVIGVKTRRDEGDLYADIVIIADGATAMLLKAMGLRGDFAPEEQVTLCKEVLSLPPEKIEERFAVEKGEGCSIEYFGEAVMGMIGGAFIYTNKDTLSVGIGISIDENLRTKVTPYNVLDYFKSHPHVRKLLEGTKVEEYSAKMIPEFGYRKLPPLYGGGFMVTGDAAGFVNTSLYHEGSNFATASGKLAAETAIEAKAKGDFSAKTLSAYRKKLDESFVMKDMALFQDVGRFIHDHPEFLTTYPDTFIKMAETYFSVTDKPKDAVMRHVVDDFKSNVRMWRFMIDSYSMAGKVLGFNPLSLVWGGSGAKGKEQG